MEIWLAGNREAHPFVPAAYWQAQAPMVRAQLLQAEVYVWEREGRILGFVGMQGDYLAGLFVDGAFRSRGIGKQLLDYIKGRRSAFFLQVYQQNRRALAFYLREGLFISGEGLDADTGSRELTLRWQRPPADKNQEKMNGKHNGIKGIK